MSKIFNSKYRILALVILILILSTAAYGFAGSNTIPDTYAGHGQGLISGYTVSAVTYVLDAGNPNAFDQVDFTLSQSATTVRVGMSAGGGTTWLAAGDCTTGNGTDFVCDLTSVGITVEAATGLHVAAAQQCNKQDLDPTIK